jgi:hypothetical protein
MSREEFESRGKVSDEIMKFREIARDSVNDGEIVLVWSWPLWGIIKKWDDDLEKIEVTTVAEPKWNLARVFPLSKMYILSPGPPELTIYDALIEAMKFAADVAGGSIDTGRIKYGGALYRAMIDKLKDEPYCKPCGDRSWSCVQRTMDRISGLNKTCFEFLEFAGMFLGSAVPESRLQTAIKGYREISEIACRYLDTNLTGENWDSPKFKAGYKSDVESMLGIHKNNAAALKIQ